MEQIWLTIKNFFLNHDSHSWLEQSFLYFAIAGLIVFIVIVVLKLRKTNKEIRELKKDERKRGKSLLKFLSNKKNNTH